MLQHSRLVAVAELLNGRGHAGATLVDIGLVEGATLSHVGHVDAFGLFDDGAVVVTIQLPGGALIAAAGLLDIDAVFYPCA